MSAAAQHPGAIPSVVPLRPSRSALTLQQHCQLEGFRPAAGLPRLLLAIAEACAALARQLRRAGIDDVLGAVGTENVQGEQQQKLDVIADRLLLDALGRCESVTVVGSEENAELLQFRRDGQGPHYAVFFDPLDGSSNLDVCGTVGTIFSIFEAPTGDALLPGSRQVAAGYALYGPSTVLVLSTGQGVQQFVLDEASGSFLRVQAQLRIPESGSLYAVNESNLASFPEGFRRFVDECRTNGFTSRYAGAMIADVHRVLTQGGIFLYPPTAKSPNGKLRLMYEANPAAFLIEQAGGLATTGQQPVLDVAPASLHQRVPLALGSPAQVQALLAMG